MNKPLATIGVATLLLGSLTMVQARDPQDNESITRQEFERAAHELEIGVEQGKISAQDARAEWHAFEKEHGEAGKN